jgi:hypothetical protein
MNNSKERKKNDEIKSTKGNKLEGQKTVKNVQICSLKQLK